MVSMLKGPKHRNLIPIRLNQTSFTFTQAKSESGISCFLHTLGPLAHYCFLSLKIFSSKTFIRKPEDGLRTQLQGEKWIHGGALPKAFQDTAKILMNMSGSRPFIRPSPSTVDEAGSGWMLKPQRGESPEDPGLV